MGKSAEEIALPYAVKIAEVFLTAMETGEKLEQPIMPIIAAAIREDRAEPVSDKIMKRPGWAMLRARHLVEEHIRIYGMVPHPDKIKEAIALALEAATADEKGGAR